MALAIASGVPPQHGLYTAIVGGAVIALLGGSRVQVSGPTAAFVAILVPISARFGVGGLLLATRDGGGDPHRAGRDRNGEARGVRALPGHDRLHRRRGRRHRDPAAARLHGPHRRSTCPSATSSAWPPSSAPSRPCTLPTWRSVPSPSPCSSLWPRVSRRWPAPLVALSRGRRGRVRGRALGPGLPLRDHQHPVRLRSGRGVAARNSPPAAVVRPALAPARRERPAHRPEPRAHPRPRPFRLRHRHAGRDRVAALGRGRGRHDRQQARSRRRARRPGRRQRGGPLLRRASRPRAPWRARPRTSARARARRWPRCATPSSCSPPCSCSPPSSATCPWPRWRPCSSSWPGTWANGGTSSISCATRRRATSWSSSPASGSRSCSTWWSR